MRSFLLAAKIAGAFVAVMFAFLAIAMHLFASMVMHPARRPGFDIGAAHDRFVVIVLVGGIATTVVLALFALWITAPARRISRSMDRIAAGDLGHRIRVRGRDELAAMGHSFNAMADRVRAMLVGQKELMAGVSHELRTPLARMKVGLELLSRDIGRNERVAALDREVDELDALVEELLLASRFDLGAVPLDATTLDLRVVAEQAWQRVERTAASAGVRLEIQLAPETTALRADRALVVRLLGNLFENAVRHAGSGTVRLRARRSGDRVALVVADEGPGVQPADLVRLFEPFFRTDRSRSRKTGAGGLGLMIVRRAVEAHGGSVEARLAEPRGLEVAFDLPAAD